MNFFVISGRTLGELEAPFPGVPQMMAFCVTAASVSLDAVVFDSVAGSCLCD